MRIICEMGVAGDDIPWPEVIRKMGHRRSRQQCSAKWSLGLLAIISSFLVIDSFRIQVDLATTPTVNPR
jgi:hypothetical protein